MDPHRSSYVPHRIAYECSSHESVEGRPAGLRVAYFGRQARLAVERILEQTGLAESGPRVSVLSGGINGGCALALEIQHTTSLALAMK